MEYVKYFGLKPPVRVCVEIPGDEIIAHFTIWNHHQEGHESGLEQFKEKQVNMHVQGISCWAPPNIGPYSQSNKMDNVMFMAGCIGLYPPALALISPDDVLLQYAQTKWNYN